jgi:hypothetical protein
MVLQLKLFTGKTGWDGKKQLWLKVNFIIIKWSALLLDSWFKGSVTLRDGDPSVTHINSL